MKKSLIIFGILALSSNIFCIQPKKDKTEIAQKPQLSKMEKVKIFGALVGCGLFAWATLFTYDARSKNQDNLSEFSWYHYPTFISLIPTALVSELIVKCGGEEIDNNILYNTVAAYTSLASLALGYYAYKKLTQSKQQQKLEKA